MLRQGLRDLLARIDGADGGGNNGGDTRGANYRARSGSRGGDQRGRENVRGAGPGGNGGAAGAARVPQQGDWTCKGCKFSPNFARRRNCFNCRRPRSPQSGRAATGNGAGALTQGPIGAGGLRPLLGGRAAATARTAAADRGADRPPTVRVPGASVAALAAEGGGGTSWADAAKRAVPGGAAAKSKPTCETVGGRASSSGGGAGDVAGADDDEGFQEVVRRGRKTATATDGGAHGHDEGRDAEGGTGTGVGRGPAHDDFDADADRDDSAEQPTVAELQQAWHDEVSLVRRLRSQGLQEEHPAMRAAVEARDAAERAWRGSKEPAPASIRLGRAQTKLDRALVLQTDARRAMQEAEQEHHDRMAGLRSTLQECTERVALRRQQLREVQDEVGGAGVPRAAGLQQFQHDAIKQVHEAICGKVGPTIAALVEQLDSEAPAWSALNGLLATLAASKTALESAVSSPPERQAGQYHIGEASDRWDGWSEWSESHDMHGQPWGNGNSGDARHDWGEGWPHGEQQDEPMGTGDWWDTPERRWGGAARWRECGFGKWSKTSWADQLEEEQGRGGDGGDDGQPPAVRRRVEASGDERTTTDATPQPTQQQHQQRPVQQQATQGSSSAAVDPNNTPEDRRRRHHERINHIVALAVEAGVTPLTASGEELIMLDEDQLHAWVAECLPSALLC